jgi:hypothetical protein
VTGVQRVLFRSDGRFAVYQDLNFEGRLCRIYEAMKKLGAMIEENAK